MTATPLLDRIKARQPQPEPTPIVERMSPFMRRLAEKRLPATDMTGRIYSDGCGPTGSAA